MRHRVGQLDSVKSVPFEELEAMRAETEARLKELEQAYWGKKEGKNFTKAMAEKYNKTTSDLHTAPDTPGPASTEKLEEPRGILKTASTPGGPGSLAKPKFNGARSKSKSVKKERSPSPIDYSDPRQQIYEAKFEKYLANKKVQKEHDLRRKSMQKEDFDLITQTRSPSKRARRCQGKGDPTRASFSGKYNADDLLDPALEKSALKEEEIRKAQLARTDPFGALGVGAADKMTFFLLKWVFNAIKHDSAEDDQHFKGASYVAQQDMVKQLAKNPEILRALNYEDQRQLADAVKNANCKKEGFLTWSEFLDFFFLGGKHSEGQDWWNQLDQAGNYISKKSDTNRT